MPSIFVAKDATKQTMFYKDNGFIWRFNGLWPKLASFHQWISSTWKPKINEEAYIQHCTKGSLIVEFGIEDERNQILNSSSWF
jgi:hypothetical protein